MKAFQDFNSPHILYQTSIPSLLVKAHSHFQVRSKQARRSRQKDISAENRYGILLSWQQSAAHPLWVTQLKHQANWKGQDRWKTLLSISRSFCYQRLRVGWGGTQGWLPGKLKLTSSDSREKETNKGVKTKTQNTFWEATHRHGIVTLNKCACHKVPVHAQCVHTCVLRSTPSSAEQHSDCGIRYTQGRQRLR